MRGWSRPFDDPIPLPGGGELRTLHCELHHREVPKAEHDTPDWRAAIEALILIADHDGDTMLPRIAIMRALHHDKPPLPPMSRKKPAKK